MSTLEPVTAVHRIQDGKVNRHDTPTGLVDRLDWWYSGMTACASVRGTGPLHLAVKFRSYKI